MKRVSVMALASVLMGGCASIAVTPDAIEDRTAFALGLSKGDFTIGNRRDDGMRTDYSVQAKNGAQYNCYVTGGVSITGRVVSDAICSQTAGAGKKAADKKPATPSAAQSNTSSSGSAPSGSGSCNALLKAAKRC